MADELCAWCNKSLSGETNASKFLGICQDCRMSKGYSKCPKLGHSADAGNYSFKDGLCLSCDKPQSEPHQGLPIKVYVGECPCGIQHPAPCEYHTIQPGSRLA